ncbi:MAG: hypothetical protein ACYDEE_17540 [Ignavibacteriaceae bacterium]
MKIHKVFFLVIFSLFYNSLLFPQDALKKGIYNLSGSISYSYSKSTSSSNEPYYNSGIANIKETYISMTPSFSYFIMNNLSIGGSISYYYAETEISLSNTTNPSSVFPKSISRNFGIGPSIRYYFSGNIIVPFLGISDFYSKNINSKQEGNIFTAVGGINYFLSNSVALEPFLSYSLSTYNKPNENTNTFSIGFRINYFIIK